MAERFLAVAVDDNSMAVFAAILSVIRIKSILRRWGRRRIGIRGNGGSPVSRIRIRRRVIGIIRRVGIIRSAHDHAPADKNPRRSIA